MYIFVVCSAERRSNRIHNNLSFSSPINGNALDYSRLTMNGDDVLSSRLKLELDRSIAKHLEAGRLAKNSSSVLYRPFYEGAGAVPF